MALSIKNREVESLLAELVAVTGESKTEAVRKALEERRRRLALQAVSPEPRVQLLAFFEEEIWSRVPAEEMGRCMSKEEEEQVLPK